MHFLIMKFSEMKLSRPFNSSNIFQPHPESIPAESALFFHLWPLPSLSSAMPLAPPKLTSPLVVSQDLRLLHFGRPWPFGSQWKSMKHHKKWRHDFIQHGSWNLMLVTSLPVHLGFADLFVKATLRKEIYEAHPSSKLRRPTGILLARSPP